jgi:hypothetical protein
MSYLCVLDKIVRENHAGGGFEVHPPHRAYWEYVAGQAALLAQRNGEDPDAARAAILDQPQARAAAEAPLYTLMDNFVDELSAAGPLRAARVAAMLATMLAVWVEEAWDVGRHLYGEAMMARPLFFSAGGLAARRAEVLRALHDPGRPLHEAMGSAVPSAERHGQLGRPAGRTSLYQDGVLRYETELYRDLSQTACTLGNPMAWFDIEELLPAAPPPKPPVVEPPVVEPPDLIADTVDLNTRSLHWNATLKS